MAGKKNYLVIATIAAVSVLCLSGINFARAYDVNLNLNTDQLSSWLQTLINSLINTGKQIWQNIGGGNNVIPNVTIPTTSGGGGGISIENTLENANLWLIRATGLNFVQIIKAVGGLVIWVLNTAADLIRQGLSLIK